MNKIPEPTRLVREKGVTVATWVFGTPEDKAAFDKALAAAFGIDSDEAAALVSAPERVCGFCEDGILSGERADICEYCEAVFCTGWCLDDHQVACPVLFPG